MYARSAFQYLDELAAEQAFDIAWFFIENTRDVADECAAQAFIATEIVRLLERGETNRLRLANAAIAAYEKACAENIAQILALGYAGR
jgi:hypothetical protein